MIEATVIPADNGQSAAQQVLNPNPSVIPTGAGPSNGPTVITDASIQTVQTD